jgi:hypothetical protein
MERNSAGACHCLGELGFRFDAVTGRMTGLRRMLQKLGIVSLVGGMVLGFAAFAGCASSGSVAPEKENVFSVLFTYTGQHESICLAGDFNDWSLDSHCLERQGDAWQIQLSLFPGRYRYGFFLDGKCCSPDPGGVLQESDGFGGKSSILIVE